MAARQTAVPRRGARRLHPATACVAELVARQAEARPHQVAVVAPDATLTYGELEQRADHLARRLRRLGVGRETVAGLCVDRSAAMVVGALAILKAGGAYLPLDPGYPDARLRFMLRDSGAGIAVTRRSQASRIRGDGRILVAVDGGAGSNGVEPAPEADAVTGPGDLAYVIYTSGSSGTPKGVLVEHRSLLNLIHWHREAFDVSAADRATLIASPAFDAAVWELWPYLTAGASVHVPAEELRADPTRLRDWLVAERITISFAPTALAGELIGLEWPAGTALRYLLTGGDVLHLHPPPRLPFPVVNNYGPTEATVVATSGVVSPASEGGARPSIGRPITHARAYIVDDQLRPVGPGQSGELLLGGDMLARGYLNRPELTTRCFIADPFSNRPPGRLYRTGDLVRQRPDGDLEFLGRLDDQVKIRGHRVEPGEIAAVLGRHPAVRSSVVVARDRASGQKELVAYVLPAGEVRPDAAELRRDLARHLPDPMLPRLFVWLETLPLTGSGKVDRAALPDPENGDATRLRSPGGTQSRLEEALAAMVAEVLGHEAVGVDENFFLLGGHSLLGAQLIARIDDRFGVEMELRSLFDNPTVAEMAREVERLLVAELDSMSDEDAEHLAGQFAARVV